MCGFSGFTNPTSDEKSEYILKKMMSPIQHRGPDAESIYINNKIALGHYRLSIIDINGGQQPCIDKINNNYLVFNGEIYGYKNHAKLLKSYGFIKIKKSKMLFRKSFEYIYENSKIDF